VAFALHLVMGDSRVAGTAYAMRPPPDVLCNTTLLHREYLNRSNFLSRLQVRPGAVCVLARHKPDPGPAQGPAACGAPALRL
jgi:hypothetical protein